MGEEEIGLNNFDAKNWLVTTQLYQTREKTTRPQEE